MTFVLQKPLFTLFSSLLYTLDVCSNEYYGLKIENDFTLEGVEQIEKAVRERNSAGDVTKLQLFIDEPSVDYRTL